MMRSWYLMIHRSEIANIEDAYIPNNNIVDDEHGAIFLCGLPEKNGVQWMFA